MSEGMDVGCKTRYNYRDPITVMTYDDYEDIRERMNARRSLRASKDRKKRAKYYSRQRLTGFLVLSIGISCMIAGCAIDVKILEYFGAAVGLFGLYMIFTKHMVLVDEYFLEKQDKFNEY